MAKQAVDARHARSSAIALSFLLALASCASAPKKPRTAPLSLDQMILTRRAMEEAIIEGHLHLAIGNFELMRNRIDRELNSPAERHEAEQIRSLAQKARLTLKFAKRNLQVGGYLVTDDEIWTAIISGMPYQIGDDLSTDLILLEIGPEWLKFLYKGVEILEKPRTAPTALNEMIFPRRYMDDALVRPAKERALAEYHAKYMAMLARLKYPSDSESFKAARQWLSRQSKGRAKRSESRGAQR